MLLIQINSQKIIGQEDFNNMNFINLSIRKNIQTLTV